MECSLFGGLGPKESIALELEEQRLSHGLRKVLMVVIFLLFVASLVSTVWYGVLEHWLSVGSLRVLPV